MTSQQENKQRAIDLHKTDWLKFRNGGRKSLIELDELLHDYGLDWAEWR